MEERKSRKNANRSRKKPLDTSVKKDLIAENHSLKE